MLLCPIFVTLALVLPSLCLNSDSPFLFKSAAFGSSLKPRSASIEPDSSRVELNFFDENSVHGFAPIGGRISFDPAYPTLILDEHRYQFDHVTCTNESIYLGFVSLGARDAAYNFWRTHDKLMFVTYETCRVNSEAHEVHLVSALTLKDKGIAVITTLVPLNSVASNVKFAFGKDVYQTHVKRSVADKKGSDADGIAERRSAEGFPIMRRTSLNRTASGSDSISVATSVTGNIFTASTLRLGCEDCYTRGRVGISDGDVALDVESETGLTGYINIAGYDLLAHLQLELDLLPSFERESHRAHLVKIDIPAIEIPVIDIQLQISFVYDILMSVSLNASMTFSSGFEAELPSVSGIHLDLEDPGNSHSVGFQHPIFRTLPLNVSNYPPEFDFKVALQPRFELSLDADIFGISAEAGLGFDLDVPAIKVSIEEVNNVNENCEPAAYNQIDHPLIKIAPTAILDASIFGDIEAKAVGFKADFATTILSTAWPLPTGCWDFDEQSGKLVSPYAPMSAPARTSDPPLPSKTTNPRIKWDVLATAEPFPNSSGMSSDASRISSHGVLLAALWLLVVGLWN